jgi:hypothetical protein
MGLQTMAILWKVLSMEQQRCIGHSVMPTQETAESQVGENKGSFMLFKSATFSVLSIYLWLYSPFV